MPNPLAASILKVKKGKKQSSYIQFSMCGGSHPWRKQQNEERAEIWAKLHACLGVESGVGHLLTMAAHWRRLGAHHDGATEGEDSQELQG